MYPLRTRFDNDIVTEFFPPYAASDPNPASRDVVIFAGGMPSMPGSKRIMDFFSKKGYWIFVPRYRGTWESDGQFLARSPHEEIRAVMDGLADGFTDLWNGVEYQVEPRRLILIGSSFGGPAVLLNAGDARVSSVICVSPVVDWTAKSEDEPLDELREIVRHAFGQGYRFADADWDKLAHGDFYNPMHEYTKIPGEKILMLHAKDDTVVPFESVKQFAAASGGALFAYKKGGHLSSKILTKWWVWRKIKRRMF